MRSSFLLLSIFFAFIVRVTSFGFPATPEGLTREAILSMIHKRYPKSNVSPSNDNDNGGAPNNQFPLHGKVAVVTGAAGGIGRELSKLIYQFGGTVVALDRNAIGLNELEHHLLSNNNHLDPQSQRIWTLETHHEDLSSVSRSADRILSRFDRVDLLINNAGLTYRPDALPGSPATKSAHGMDLSFTVNYLSHFLLTEKLLPLLSSADEGGRVVHLTSTYHWKVDGTELIPPPRATATSSSSREGPPAYQSDPSKQSRQHVPRAYANSKLAQLWHSRSLRIPNGTSVCACPTWAATGIGGDDARSFLQRHAFGIDDCGPGVTSAVNAMFRTEEELGGAANDGREFVANSRVLEWIPGKRHLLAGELVTKVLGWRDGVTDLLGLVLLFGQRFGYEDFIIQETSPESFGKEEERRLFYDWSLEEVKDYL